MKTRYFFFSVLSAAMMAGCSSDDLGLSTTNGSTASEGEGLRFASVMQEEYQNLGEQCMDGDEPMATRAALSGLDIQWQIGDEMSISDGTLMYSYNVNSTDGVSCTFSAVDGHREYGSEGTFYAMYPRRAITEADGGQWNGSKFTAQVFAQQSVKENRPDLYKTSADKNINSIGYFGGYYVTNGAAVNKNGTFTFNLRPLISVIDVNVAGLGLPGDEHIASVSIISKNYVTLAGHFTYDVVTSKMNTENMAGTNYAYTSKSDVVTVHFYDKEENDGHTLYPTPSDGLVRFYVLPRLLENGVTITIRTDKGNCYTKSASASVGDTSNSYIINANSDKDLGTTVKPYYKKYNFGSISTAKQGNIMATFPSNLHMSQLTLAGAHDAVTSTFSARSTTAQKMSHTQDLNLEQQLLAGVRAFDLRPAYKGINGAPTMNTLMLYHGVMNTGVTFKSAMDQFLTFLDAHPTETVVVLVNKEDASSSLGAVLSLVGVSYDSDGKDYSEDANGCKWQQSIREYIAANSAKFVASIETPINLSACRGKVVFMSRNYYGTTQAATTPVYGGVIRTWADNATFNAQLYKNGGAGSSAVRVQDEYMAANKDVKQSAIGALIEESTADAADRWYINFVSMAENLTATNYLFDNNSIKPSYWASLNNTWLLNQINAGTYKGRLGMVFFDFCGTNDADYHGKDLLQSLINHNYTYIYQKRTRVIFDDLQSSSTGGSVAEDEFADYTETYARRQRF